MQINRQAFGIPFHTSDEAAIDAACRHHGAMITTHSVEKLLMPFWVFVTSCGGKFRADILQRDPTLMTSTRNVWVNGPVYNFAYPLEEHFTFNQVSASYLQPSTALESCVCGSHVPGMLLQRFELLEELEAMEHKAKLVPFIMSTDTAVRTIEARISRGMILQFIDKELKKFHGSFVDSSVALLGVSVEAVKVRPVFLPVYKMMVTTRSHNTPVPTFVCGATGKATGPVLHQSNKRRAVAAGVAAATAVLTTAPLLGPGIATSAAIGSAIASSVLMKWFARAKFLKAAARDMAELETTGMLNFGTDQQGYRWVVEDEEKAEYEYREELRRRARRKDEFEQRVREEQERDDARARKMRFDPKNRRRSDLRNLDPLGYYRVLGLTGQEVSATFKDIQSAFREESKKHHPDTNAGNEEEAKKTMQKILEAYKILRNAKSKKDYDTGVLKREHEAEE